MSGISGITLGSGGGIRLHGAPGIGDSVSAAGDVNGDGYDDFVIGGTGGEFGRAYVVFGGASLAPSDIDLDELAPERGFAIEGFRSGANLGWSVSGAGDVNGDGFDDILMGAPYADPSGTDQGESYLVFGRDFTATVTHAPPTGGDDVLVGDGAANIMVGGNGNDTLTGNGGADVLIGGSGDDSLVVGDLSFRKVAGGSGQDTLRLSAPTTLNLGTVANNKITGIERVDLMMGVNSSLILGLADVLAMTDGINTLPTIDGGNTLVIDGDAGDKVILGNPWTRNSDVAFGGNTYRHYVGGAAAVYIDADIGTVAVPTLAGLNGTNGFVFNGVNTYDQAGQSVAGGDFNGDGLADLLTSAADADPAGGAQAGKTYVVYGNTSATAAEAADVVLNGIDGGDKSGFAVAGADFNGDGIDDILIGARYGDQNAANSLGNSGEAYLVFGNAAGLTNPFDLGTGLTGSAGTWFQPTQAGEFAGQSVASAGDLNGDGRDDLIIGAPFWDNGGTNSAGRAYVVFGAASVAATFNLSGMTGSTGFTFNGAATYDYAGRSVSGAGDINGDGFADLIIGVPEADPNGNGSGKAVVVFGKASGFAASVSAASLGSGGFVVNGGAAYDHAGSSVSSAGDWNGDGFDDIAVGADALGSTNSGGGYIVFGGAGLAGATVSLSGVAAGTIGSGGGIALVGPTTGGSLGQAIASAGDVNGDGYDDLLIGGAQEGASRGQVFVLFGGNVAAGATLDLATLAPQRGFRLDGANANDYAGQSVRGIGDANGDGYDDFAVGAKRADPSAVNGAGQTYVIYGNDFTGAVTHQGGSTADNFFGTGAADVMVGGLGDDTLTGSGGADALRGGAGNDTLVVSDTTFRRLDGGAGADALRLGASMTLNFASIPNNRINGIEKLDLTFASSAVALSALDVLAVTDGRNTFNTGSPGGTANTLFIDGDAGDEVTATDGGWTEDSESPRSIGGQSYHVYLKNGVQLFVDTDIDQHVVAQSINLSSMTATQGLRIYSDEAGGNLGFGVGGGGDLNGDGFADIVAGAHRSDYDTSNDGQVFAVFGGVDADGTKTMPGDSGASAAGSGANRYAGEFVGWLGDVNGDGFADMAFGARNESAGGPSAGAAYIVFGGAGLAGSVSLNTLSAASSGFRIDGSAYDTLARVSNSPGDVNGDGINDVVVGAPNVGASDGKAYIVFGRTDFAAATGGDSAFGAADVTGSIGFALTGPGDEFAGRSLSIGDIDGDGLDDVIVGAPFADHTALTNPGKAYVFFGKTSGLSDVGLATLDPSGGGFELKGAASGAEAGTSVAYAGDVNGDGFGDLLVGAPETDLPENNNRGTTYLVFGGASLDGASISLGAIGSLAVGAGGGVTIAGASNYSYSGHSVSRAGDVNGDGYDDILIGAPAIESANAGNAYIIFGGAGLGVGTTIELANLGPLAGVALNGVVAGGSSDYTGFSVSAAGDVDGDGLDDVVIGSPYGNSSGNAPGDQGRTYVVYGDDFTGAITHQNLPGNAGANVIVGNSAANFLQGFGGADVIRAGAGEDTISIGDASFFRIDGGAQSLATTTVAGIKILTERDTLQLMGDFDLNLTTIANGKITGIEEIDIAGTGANYLALRQQDVFDLSDSTNTLIIRGGADDQVGLWDNGWTKTTTTPEVVEGLSYHIYSLGNAKVLISSLMPDAQIGNP